MEEPVESFFRSKTNITGLAMLALGALDLVLPGTAEQIGVPMEGSTLIAVGLQTIWLRLGIAKNGIGK